DAMPRDGRRCSKLGKAAHQHDRESLIAGSGSGACLCRACRAKPDGAWLKTLILREESFCESVPAIAQLIHFGRREDMYLGQRDELNSGGSKCIEPRQLAPARGESQRKSLRAVPKEITPADQIILAEAVVNLCNNAA